VQVLPDRICEEEGVILVLIVDYLLLHDLQEVVEDLCLAMDGYVGEVGDGLEEDLLLEQELLLFFAMVEGLDLGLDQREHEGVWGELCGLQGRAYLRVGKHLYKGLHSTLPYATGLHLQG
jgi:hypothetical protein